MPPVAAAPRPVHTYCFLLAFCILAVIWGVRNVYHDKPSPIDLLVPVAMAFCMGTWSVLDARRRRNPIPRSAQAWFFLLAGVVVPCYIVWSRGWRGLGWLMLYAVLWLVLSTGFATQLSRDC
jgi:hypothetical protein